MAFHRISVSYGSSTVELVERLIQVVEELAGLHKELAAVLQAERQAKINTFAQSQAETVTAREREANLMSLDMTCAVYDVKGQIEALVEERDLLRLLIEVVAP